MRPPSPSTETFETAPLTEGARVRYWNDAARQVFDAIEVEPFSRGFNGQLRRRCFGALQLASVRSTPVAVRATASTRLRGVYLMVNEQGHCELEQRGRRDRLRAGELTVLCAHEPYRLVCGSEHHTHVLYVPGATLTDALDPHIAVSHGGADSALLSAFVLRLSRFGGPLAVHTLQDTVLTLLHMTWPPQPAAALPRGPAEPWQERLYRHIEHHLQDPELDAERLAAHFSISSRYVQMIFARGGSTFSRFLLERRLQWVADQLHGGDAQPIGQLALAAGFNDLSHFCRSFRARFGVSARVFRARQGA